MLSSLPSAAEEDPVPGLASVELPVGDEESVFVVEVLEATGKEDIVVVVGVDKVPCDESVAVPALALRPMLGPLSSQRSFKLSQLLASAPCNASNTKASARKSTNNDLMGFDDILLEFLFA
ncbi:hypothetical protein CRG98_031528 [Punica granatum]|uniref:Uncharacterized protein n=1 Tax=Punica granatum TaxID=22663 RepID=A0A2I0IVS0_PUNGR|nr:hypothetical protein CRG98_031528 [Punica granatum]